MRRTDAARFASSFRTLTKDTIALEGDEKTRSIFFDDGRRVNAVLTLQIVVKVSCTRFISFVPHAAEKRKSSEPYNE